MFLLEAASTEKIFLACPYGEGRQTCFALTRKMIFAVLSKAFLAACARGVVKARWLHVGMKHLLQCTCLSCLFIWLACTAKVQDPAERLENPEARSKQHNTNKASMAAAGKLSTVSM